MTGAVPDTWPRAPWPAPGSPPLPAPHAGNAAGEHPPSCPTAHRCVTRCGHRAARGDSARSMRQGPPQSPGCERAGVEYAPNESSLLHGVPELPQQRDRVALVRLVCPDVLARLPRRPGGEVPVQRVEAGPGEARGGRLRARRHPWGPCMEPRCTGAIAVPRNSDGRPNGSRA